MISRPLEHLLPPYPLCRVDVSYLVARHPVCSPTQVRYPLSHTRPRTTPSRRERSSDCHPLACTSSPAPGTGKRIDAALQPHSGLRTWNADVRGPPRRGETPLPLSPPIFALLSPPPSTFLGFGLSFSFSFVFFSFLVYSSLRRQFVDFSRCSTEGLEGLSVRGVCSKL